MAASCVYRHPYIANRLPSPWDKGRANGDTGGAFPAEVPRAPGSLSECAGAPTLPFGSSRDRPERTLNKQSGLIQGAGGQAGRPHAAFRGNPGPQDAGPVASRARSCLPSGRARREPGSCLCRGRGRRAEGQLLAVHLCGFVDGQPGPASAGRVGTALSLPDFQRTALGQAVSGPSRPLKCTAQLSAARRLPRG